VAIAECVHACAPAEVSTPEIALALEAKFGIKFPSKKLRKRWVHSCVVGRLNEMASQGILDRLHETTVGFNGRGRWRWKKQQATTMAELRAMAAAAGIGTVQADDIPDGPPEGAAEGVEG
jgi:hypothetical protein